MDVIEKYKHTLPIRSAQISSQLSSQVSAQLSAQLSAQFSAQLYAHLALPQHQQHQHQHQQQHQSSQQTLTANGGCLGRNPDLITRFQSPELSTTTTTTTTTTINRITNINTTNTTNNHVLSSTYIESNNTNTTNNIDDLSSLHRISTVLLVDDALMNRKMARRLLMHDIDTILEAED
eukprot:gene8103-16638_t